MVLRGSIFILFPPSFCFCLAALFFFSYECMKRLIGEKRQNALSYSISSSLSEVVACSVRVPVEIVKQRMQVSGTNNIFAMVQGILKSEGGWGLYRGFTATIQREIPFAAIQFPVYEALKSRFARDDRIEMALCGSAAGGFTAFLTTPLDVLKTRTMLNPTDNPSLKKLWREGGLRCLFAGAVPRVMWISIGGFVFFGVYEKALAHLKEI